MCTYHKTDATVDNTANHYVTPFDNNVHDIILLYKITNCKNNRWNTLHRLVDAKIKIKIGTARVNAPRLFYKKPIVSKQNNCTYMSLLTTFENYFGKTKINSFVILSPTVYDLMNGKNLDSSKFENAGFWDSRNPKSGNLTFFISKIWV